MAVRNKDDAKKKIMNLSFIQNKNATITMVVYVLLFGFSNLSVLNGFQIHSSQAMLLKKATATTLRRAVPRVVNSSSSSRVFMSGGSTPSNSLIKGAQKILDDTTGGWALSYVDLSPETEQTSLGMTFLATNVGYAICGVLLSMKGDLLLGTLTELASVASFGYHYNQLKFGTDATAPEVRLALLVDYVVAITSMSVATGYLVMNGELPPLEVIVAASLSLACLFASWVWEDRLSYIFWHSLWHLFGAYTGFLIGGLRLLQ